MRKALLPFALFFAVVQVSAQTYFEDFESFENSDYIAKESKQWTTWGNKPGSQEDARVVSSKAYSGSNSVYLNSTSTDGGPQDLVLPFGNKYDIGNFDYSMMMYLQAGKGAYFNFQGEKEVGEIWCLNFESSGQGEYRIYNSAGTVVEGNLPIDEWAKISFKLDLSTNRWSFLANDQLMGTWNNEFNALASINLYPTNNYSASGTSRFWIDDVSYTYTPFIANGTNIAVVGFDHEGLLFPNQEIQATAFVRNLGLEDITSFELDLKYGQHHEVKTFSKIQLTTGQVIQVSFDLPVSVLPESTDMAIAVSKVNGMESDDNMDDDLLTSMIVPTIPASGKMVILEEGTGTWCGWCPRGMVSLETIEKKYGDMFQGIAVHSGDPMEAPGYSAPFVSAYVSGFPSGQVERERTIGMAPEASEAAFLEALIQPAHCTIETAAKLDRETNTLSVSATYTFTDNVSGSWKVACALIENGVTGNDDGYSQSNYFAGGSNGEMDGWENRASDVHFSEMVYDDVARAISPNYKGVDALPANIEKGQSYTFEFTFKVKEDWNTENMRVVPLCFDPDGSVDNGDSETITDAINHSYQEGELISSVELITELSATEVYPNPATEIINLSGEDMGHVELMDLNGRVILTSNKNSLNHQINIAGFQQGFYLLKLSNAEGSTIQTVVIK